MFLAVLVFTQQSYCRGMGICLSSILVFVRSDFSETVAWIKENFMGTYQSTIFPEHFKLYLCLHSSATVIMSSFDILSVIR